MVSGEERTNPTNTSLAGCWKNDILLLLPLHQLEMELREQPTSWRHCEACSHSDSGSKTNLSG